jgi:uncharacterized protein YjbI with pentapeptide repeats
MSTVHNTVLGEVDPGPALAGADLSGALLAGADFAGADLTSAKLIAPFGLDAVRNLDKALNLDRSERR